MDGFLLARLACCLIFSVAINISDWRERRIRNWEACAFALAGLAVNLVGGGGAGFLHALGGGAVMLLLFPVFALRMLGAGDVKALMAVGCMAGLPMAFWILVYSIIGAGALALIVLLSRRNAPERLKRLWNYCKFCLLTRRLQPYTQTLGEDGSGFCFSFGITLGVLAALIESLV